MGNTDNLMKSMNFFVNRQSHNRQFGEKMNVIHLENAVQNPPPSGRLTMRINFYKFSFPVRINSRASRRNHERRNCIGETITG
jgi:hypothetical protein